MLAAAAGQVDTVRLLIDNGADLNAKNDDGSTALMVAALKGHLEIVRTLLAAGADVSVQDLDQDSALKLAVENGHAELVKILLEQGAYYQLKNGRTPLMGAAERGDLAVAPETARAKRR
jgi:ankyrin repeat protein